MEKDIRFTGYTATPSDYESSDGELTQCHNLISEDGAIHSLLAPKVIANLGKDEEVVYIHKSNSFRGSHYIVHNTSNGNLYWMSDIDNTISDNNKIGEFQGELSFNAIGNTVIVLSKTQMHYILWDVKISNYKNLGSHIPECSLSFGLQTEIDSSVEFDMSTSGDVMWHDRITSTQISWRKYAKELADQMLGAVNKFMAEKVTGKGKFALPFFVRYAFRLFDGSLTMHSAPILMTCNAGYPFIIKARDFTRGSTERSQHCKMFCAVHQLDYQCEEEIKSALTEWSDIIKSVDIFISAPIYSYSIEDGIGGTLSNAKVENQCMSVCKLIKQSANTTTYPQTYQAQSLLQMYAKATNYNYNGTVNNDTFPEGYRGDHVFHPILYTQDGMAKKFASNSNFYLLTSLSIDELATERKLLPIEENHLSSLVTRESMSDDFDSHDTLLPTTTFTYNNRLSLANVRKRMFNGFNPLAVLPFSDGVHTLRTIEGTSNKYAAKQIYQFEVKLVVNGKTMKLKSDSVYLADELGRFFWFYYPHTGATLLIVHKTLLDSNGQMGLKTSVTHELSNHDFLNGSFLFIDAYESNSAIRPGGGRRAMEIIDEEDFYIDAPNKIYTSDINNPFRFDVTNINTIGTGTILGLSSAAKALSQGQFGQFPLYAFTTEGIWALEVSSTTGAFSARQPITRDVCISSDSITQIDSSVLFATERGIMEISGSTTSCITDIINGPEFFDLAKLPGLASLYPQGLPKIDCTFAEYRKSARMAYDYTNRRIFLFNPTKNYAYVFSMKSKLWGIMASTLLSALNSYPDALAMARTDSGNTLVDLSHSDLTSAHGLIVTRPIKLDAGSMLKTFDAVFLRGLFGKRKVQTILYGSRDNISWHLVHSSKEHFLTGLRGTPYKYFRICAITNLSVGETLVGASVSYTPRLTNKMR